MATSVNWGVLKKGFRAFSKAAWLGVDRRQASS